LARNVSITPIIGPEEAKEVAISFTAASSTFNVLVEGKGSPPTTMVKMDSAMVSEESGATYSRIAYFTFLGGTVTKPPGRHVMTFESEHCKAQLNADILFKITQVYIVVFFACLPFLC